MPDPLILPFPDLDSANRHPRIGYKNLGVGATITSDSTASGYAAANAFDWKPYTYWKPAATGSHYIQIVLASPQGANYFACAQHNIGTNGGTITLQYSADSGSTWTNVFSAVAPTGSESKWINFSTISSDYWRVVVDAPVASVLGVVSFGQVYQPQYGAWNGFQPPGMARMIDQYAGLSEGGLFLGRSILRKTLKSSITFDHMEMSDVYSLWLPFVKHAEQFPFFLAWMTDDWPDDVVLMQADGAIPNPKMSEFGRMQTVLPMRGLLTV